MFKVYLSPSNQANNVGYGKFGTEKARMIELAEKVRDRLINNFEVKMANYDSTLASRVVESNKWGADIYYALHTNAGGGRGCECFAYSTTSKGNELAHCIYQELVAIIPSGGRGVKYNNLYETKNPNAPACLSECIFHDNKEDVEWYLNNIDNVATAIAKGIYKYFKMEYNPNPQPEPTPQPTPQPTSYTYKDFVGDAQKAIGAKVDYIAGPETLGKTPTISKSKNRTHAVVKPVQKYLYSLGYTEVGEADGIAGPAFDKAMKHYQKDHGCYVDGEATSRQLTWKKLLNMA